jgi:hypothetical protein
MRKKMRRRSKRKMREGKRRVSLKGRLRRT